jgi:hypothetical protein
MNLKLSVISLGVALFVGSLASAIAANGSSLLDMSEQMDEVEKQDFQAAIDKANACTRARNFPCAEAEHAKAKKAANSQSDKRMLLESQGNLAYEIKREEEERQAQLRKEKEERQAQLRKEQEEKRAEVSREKERRERIWREKQLAWAEDEQQSTREYNAAIGAQILQRGAENAAILNNIDRQTYAAVADSNRVLAEQAEERNRARAERDEREAERRRDEAEHERAARAEAERSARAGAEDSSYEPPKYQPQVVTLPTFDLACPPGSTWHNAEGTGARGGTCYGDSQAQGQTETGSNANSSSDTPLADAGTSSRPQTPHSSGENSRSDRPGPATSERQPPKTEWGPIQLEALAICRKSEKNGKWWCDGPGQDDIIFDSPTVEDALESVGCSPATSAAGGTTKDGKQGDVYRCGYGLRSYDRNIAKIHRLVTAQRSYICPKNDIAKCTDFYDGQDKR